MRHGGSQQVLRTPPRACAVESVRTFPRVSRLHVHGQGVAERRHTILACVARPLARSDSCSVCPIWAIGTTSCRCSTRGRTSFAAPGTRTTGNSAGDFAITTGPGWSGRFPPKVTRIDAPTNMAWLIGRTETRGHSDYTAVRRIQERYALRDLDSWGSDYRPPNRRCVGPWVDALTPPVTQVAEWMPQRSSRGSMCSWQAIRPLPPMRMPWRAFLPWGFDLACRSTRTRSRQHSV